jgi:hypothetical protein
VGGIGNRQLAKKEEVFMLKTQPTTAYMFICVVQIIIGKKETKRQKREREGNYIHIFTVNYNEDESN